MTIEQRLEQVEQQNQKIQLQNQRIQRTNKRLTVALTMMLAGFVLAFSVGASLVDDDPIRIPKDDFLRLMISDQLREAFGLWIDPLHWRVIICADTEKARQGWENFYREGQKGIYIGVDHPNGVDQSKYKESYPNLENAAAQSVEFVLERYGLSDFYGVKADYVSKKALGW
jgi:hypothetical protein